MYVFHYMICQYSNYIVVLDTDSSYTGDRLNCWPQTAMTKVRVHDLQYGFSRHIVSIIYSNRIHDMSLASPIFTVEWLLRPIGQW